MKQTPRVVRRYRAPRRRHTCHAQCAGSDRSGVALIMTLGILSLLLILAFTFAVSMQIERIASIATTDGMQARQSVSEAFSLAARDIAASIYARGQVYPPRQWIPPRNPPSVWEPHGQYAGGTGPTQLVDGFAITASNWVPKAYFDEAMWAATNVKWKTMFALGKEVKGYLVKPAGYKGVGVGRRVKLAPICDEPVVTAALTVNCSGFLDPHIVGRTTGPTERLYGTDPAEITPTNSSLMSAIVPVFDPDDPAESYYELTLRMAKLGYLDGDPSRQFFFYSHFPLGEYLYKVQGGADEVRPAVYAKDEAAITANPRAILDAFSDAGFVGTYLNADNSTINSGVLRGWLYTNLLDYVDADTDPAGTGLGKFAHPCQEALPAINEILVVSRYSVEVQGSNYNFLVEDSVIHELWTPYISSGPFSGLQMSGRARFTPIGDLANATFSFATPADYPMAVNQQVSMNQREFAVVTNGVWGRPQLARSFTTTNYFAFTNATYELRAYDLALRSSGQPETDKILGDVIVNIDMSLPGNPTGTTMSVTQSNLFACLDPRFNWDPSAAWQWRWTNAPSEATLGSINQWTTNYMAANAGSRTERADGDTFMYCADQALRSKGEIGYLVYLPWRTVRLYDPFGETNYHAVLDTFTIIPTNQVSAKGLINPNSEFPGVLAAAFNGMSIDMHPDATQTNADRIEPSEAVMLAEAITNHTMDEFFVNVSDMGNMTEVFANTNLLVNVLRANTEFEKESILRNSADLFNTRQWMFTSIMAASYVSAEDRFGGRENSDWHYVVNEDAVRSSERRAVCLFWFDAFTGESFVRFFKYLDN